MCALETFTDLLLCRNQRISDRSRSKKLVCLDTEDVEVFHVSYIVLTERDVDVLVLIALQFCGSVINRKILNRRDRDLIESVRNC